MYNIGELHRQRRRKMAKNVHPCTEENQKKRVEEMKKMTDAEWEKAHCDGCGSDDTIQENGLCRNCRNIEPYPSGW